MAMRFRSKVLGYIRGNSLSTLPASLGARSYFSVSQVSAPVFVEFLSSASAILVVLSGWGYGAYCAFRANVFGLRVMCDAWKVDTMELETIAKLDREKYESPNAYVETLDREVKAMKAKVLERENDFVELVACKRQVDVLKAKICACADEVTNGHQ